MVDMKALFASSAPNTEYMQPVIEGTGATRNEAQVDAYSVGMQAQVIDIDDAPIPLLQTVWRRRDLDLNPHNFGSTIHNGVLYAAQLVAVEPKIRSFSAIDLKTGQTSWSLPADEVEYLHVSVKGEYLFVQELEKGDTRRSKHTIRKLNGDLVWEKEGFWPYGASTRAVIGDRAYLYDHPVIKVVDLKTGDELKSIRTHSSPSNRRPQFTVQDGLIIVIDDKLEVFDAETFEPLIEEELAGEHRGAAVVYNGNVVIGNENKILSFDTSNGTLKTTYTARFAKATPFVIDDELYVQSDNVEPGEPEGETAIEKLNEEGSAQSWVTVLDGKFFTPKAVGKTLAIREEHWIWSESGKAVGVDKETGEIRYTLGANTQHSVKLQGDIWLVENELLQKIGVINADSGEMMSHLDIGGAAEIYDPESGDVKAFHNYDDKIYVFGLDGSDELKPFSLRNVTELAEYFGNVDNLLLFGGSDQVVVYRAPTTFRAHERLS